MHDYKIKFNKPFIIGKELEYIQQAVNSGKISGNGQFTKKCQKWFEEKYSFKKAFLTTSCTDALEMSALLMNIQPGDEIIMPSYTFVSTANAFVLRGAKIVFADSCSNHPNIDADKIEELITPKTKAIVVMHYAGMAVDMDKVMSIAHRHNLFVVEDAAQAIDSFYKGKPLGGIGDFGAFSFHETKNIIAGEGGMLTIKNEKDIAKAEIFWEKGTNRAAYFRGEIDKYNWVDIGSSFLPSEITSAFLWAQLENIDTIQEKRVWIWNQYYEQLTELSNYIELPNVPEYATNNGHFFYILCKNVDERQDLIEYLKKYDIMAVFHYLSLHSSPYYKDKHDGRELPNSDRFSNCLLRLPSYFQLAEEEITLVCNKIKEFYTS